MHKLDAVVHNCFPMLGSTTPRHNPKLKTSQCRRNRRSSHHSAITLAW